MHPKAILTSILLLLFVSNIFSQPERWQQRVEYDMFIDFDVKTHQFAGRQVLKYFNNSPDTLDRVFYHLYFNAFQPGSSMDTRNKFIKDPDRRVGNEISNLKPEEYGWHKIESLKMDGNPLQYEVNETILEVKLSRPILPHSTAVFEMKFQSQVPAQVRRSGRFNRDGIDYTMTQWYPKMCNYDYQGWHANPYIGREFYGVWGDFNVWIDIDPRYIIGASGILENWNAVGAGYEPEGAEVNIPSSEKITWHFSAKNVHDFAWAADPDYRHVKLERKDGLMLHFFYLDDEKFGKHWASMPPIMDRVFDYINTHLGQYPYKSYAFIQGGDGGMEYPMATMLSGTAGVGTFIHELVHAWYYGILGTNESLHSWMDEGFTEYFTEEIENWLRTEKLIPGNPVDNPHSSSNLNYIMFSKSGEAEPLSTHADHFNTNRAYGVGAYVGGHVFLTQLDYIMGKKVFDKAILKYFDTWKFKHPNPNDFIRVMEKSSGLELDWFKEYFIYSTKSIDYGVASVERLNRHETKINLQRIGEMPMPIDLVITFRNGKQAVYNIPLDIMRGEKQNEWPAKTYTVLKDWAWANPYYSFTLNEAFRNIKSIEIDNSFRLVDANRNNNKWLNPDSDQSENEDK